MTRYKNHVKYWLIFTEINMILHLPFMGGRLVIEDKRTVLLDQYTAIHHELVASALATKLAHEINPDNQGGCMLAAGQTYGNTCAP